jgi:hypothetical protein
VVRPDRTTILPGGPVSITSLQGEYGRVGFAVLVLAVLTCLLVLIGWLRRGGRLRSAQVLAGASFAGVLLGVLSLTLVGWDWGAERRLFLDPIQGAWGWSSIAWRPVIDNIALFVPIGATATAVWWRRSPATVFVACALLSVAIEAFQYLVPTGRVANTADVLANALGALVGILLGLVARPRAAPTTSHRPPPVRSTAG